MIFKICFPNIHFIVFIFGVGKDKINTINIYRIFRESTHGKRIPQYLIFRGAEPSEGSAETEDIPNPFNLFG